MSAENQTTVVTKNDRARAQLLADDIERHGLRVVADSEHEDEASLIVKALRALKEPANG